MSFLHKLWLFSGRGGDWGAKGIFLTFVIIGGGIGRSGLEGGAINLLGHTSESESLGPHPGCRKRPGLHVLTPFF